MPWSHARPRRILALLILIPILGCAGGTVDDQASTEPPVEPAAAPSVEDALSRLRAQDAEGAAGVLEQVVEAEPDNARAWSMLGFARRQLQQTDEALAAYQKAVEVDPTNYNALYGVAALQAQRGEAEAALDVLHQLKATGEYNLSALTLDNALEGLKDDERFQDLLMKPEDFVDPFVEPARVIHEWQGEAEGDVFGWIARNIGDVDGDGLDDVVTSATNADRQAGRVYAYSSASGKLLWSASGEQGDTLGTGVEWAGDVDGDGVSDVVASAPGGGKVYAYSGREGKVLLTLEAAQEGESFGRDVVGVGDVDGDGHGDLLVGSPLNDAAGENAGRVTIYSGRDGSPLKEWQGEAGDRLGAAVAGTAGDDGPYYILGAPDAGDGDGGRVYVYDGLDGEPKFVIDSDDKGSELGGMFLSVVGDVDADGTADIYASDWQHGAKGPTTGRIVVHSGADGRQLLAIDGETPGDGFGIGPADAGDADGDGHDDLIVGAWQHSSAAPGGGKVYLFSGRDGSLIRGWTCKVMGDTFGFDATGMGDVDGDGAIDYLLTSAWSAVNGARSGRVFLLSGGP